MDFNQPPVVRAYADPERPPLAPRQWPLTVPAVAQVVAEGIELAPGVTFLVGENGSGKSTLVEGVAMAFGLSPEGGSTQGHHSTRASESDLGRLLRIDRGLGSSRWGFFLRAETMHGWYTYLEDHPAPHDPRFHSSGFYCLDEPEAALSFSSVLGLVSVLQGVVEAGGQVLCATHSPVLAAMPGAR